MRGVLLVRLWRQQYWVRSAPLTQSTIHTRSPPLSLSHTHIGEPVQLPCSASSAAAARRNEWLLRTLTFITGGSCKNWFQPINEEVSRTRAVSSLAEIWRGWPKGEGAPVRRPILGNPLQDLATNYNVLPITLSTPSSHSQKKKKKTQQRMP